MFEKRRTTHNLRNEEERELYKERELQGAIQCLYVASYPSFQVPGDEFLALSISRLNSFRARLALHIDETNRVIWLPPSKDYWICIIDATAP